MTLEVVEDLIKGSTSQSLSSGWTSTRVFFASDVTGNPDAIGYEAISNGAVPRVGEPHPTIPLLIVDTVGSKPEGARQVEITITYKPMSSGGGTDPDEESQTQMSVGGSVQSVQTNKHIVKNKGKKDSEEKIILEYIYPDNLSPEGKPKGFIYKSVGTISKQVPNIVVTFSRTESNNPLAKTIKYQSKLNAKPFLNEKEGYWMCTNLSGSSNDGGLTYQVNYEFTRSEGGWSTTVAFADERTGKIPEDVGEKGNEKALQTVVTQEKIDFNNLRLGPLTKPVNAR
jgi:hypothetical protein